MYMSRNTMLPKLDSATIQLLKRSWNHKYPQECVSVEAVIDASLKFWDNFPSNTARLHILEQDGVSTNKLTEFVNSVYPIVHHNTINLMVDFLQHKRTKGSSVERKLYGDLDLLGFVDRLLKKRPLSFLGTNDRYLLKNLKRGSGFFEKIGTDYEEFPLVLSDLLSYDEMRVSALLSVSSWSVFVNNGRRKNNGEKDSSGTFQPEGVIVGQVGPRLKKSGVMEYLDCLVSRKDNIEKYGFGCRNQDHINSAWSKFWGGNLPTYESANSACNASRDGQSNSCDDPFEYMFLDKETIFNVTVYKKRIAITAEILLCEANTRAKACKKKAYVHVVGLGLGVFKASSKQEKFFVEAWGDALKNVSGLDNVAYVDFSWIDCFTVHGVKHGEKFPNTNITIYFSKRNLHDVVPPDCMLVCNYAWDGNSLPGNEFWMGKICSTGDSAAACSSCVAEIHNHLLNPVVCAASLRVTTCDGRVLPVTEFVEELSSAESNMKPHQEKKKPQQETPTSAGTRSSGTAWGEERGATASYDANVDKISWAAHSFSAKKEEATTSYDVDMNETSRASCNSSSARAEVSVAVGSTVEATAKPSSVDMVTDAAVQQSCGVSQRDLATPCSIAPSESKPVAVDVIPKTIPHHSIPGLSIPNPDYVEPGKSSKKKKLGNKGKPSGVDGSCHKKAQPSPGKDKNDGRNKNMQQKSGKQEHRTDKKSTVNKNKK